MLHEIYPSVFDNSFKPRPPREGDVVILFGKGTALAREEGDRLEVPHFPALNADEGDYLFRIDDIAYYGRFIEGEMPAIGEGFGLVPLRSTFGKEPVVLPFAITTGYHIAAWKHYHRFCGVCGTPLVLSATERALTCPKCRHTIYPDIHPAVNIAIRNGDSLLLIRNNSAAGVRYSLVAGFVEIGETAEDTVRREPMEEVGLKVKNIHYYASQPWGIVENLQIGFFCDVDGDPTIRVDGNEVKDAVWVKRSEIPPRDNSSITGRLINAFRAGEI